MSEKNIIGMSFFVEPFDVTNEYRGAWRSIKFVALVSVVTGVVLYAYYAIWDPVRLRLYPWLFFPAMMLIAGLVPWFATDRWRIKSLNGRYETALSCAGTSSQVCRSM